MRFFSKSVVQMKQIQWTDYSTESVVSHLAVESSECKGGIELIVHPYQLAILVFEGEYSRVFPSGNYQLTSDDNSIIRTIKNRRFFQSSGNVDVYFMWHQLVFDINWEAQNIVLLNDPEYREIQFGAYGTYSFQIIDPTLFIREILKSEPKDAAAHGNIDVLIRQFAVACLNQYVNDSGISLLDFATNFAEFSQELTFGLKADFYDCGLELFRFEVEGVTLPPEIEKNVTLKKVLPLSEHRSMTYQSENTSGLSEEVWEIPVEHTGNITSAQGLSVTFSPPPQMYRVVVNGQKQGSYTEAQIRVMLENKIINPETLIWKKGMPAWQMLKTHPELMG